MDHASCINMCAYKKINRPGCPPPSPSRQHPRSLPSCIRLAVARRLLTSRLTGIHMFMCMPSSSCVTCLMSIRIRTYIWRMTRIDMIYASYLWGASPWYPNPHVCHVWLGHVSSMTHPYDVYHFDTHTHIDTHIDTQIDTQIDRQIDIIYHLHTYHICLISMTCVTLIGIWTYLWCILWIATRLSRR